MILNAELSGSSDLAASEWRTSLRIARHPLRSKLEPRKLDRFSLNKWPFWMALLDRRAQQAEKEGTLELLDRLSGFLERRSLLVWFQFKRERIVGVALAYYLFPGKRYYGPAAIA